MQFKDIIERAKKAREYEVKCGPRTYRMCLPTEHEKRVAFIKHKALREDDAAGYTAAMRDLVIGAVIGWQGVTLQDLVPDAEAPVPVEFDASLVETLMDAQDDDACELSNDLTTRILGRMKGLEESAKK